MLDLGVFCIGGLALSVVLAVIAGVAYFCQQEKEKSKLEEMTK
jgi:hypothetical protein